MNTIAISQMDELVEMDNERLSRRVIELERFIWVLAQIYFAQDDISRQMTAADRKNDSIGLVVNGKEARSHWDSVKGQDRFAEDFESIERIMEFFRSFFNQDDFNLDESHFSQLGNLLGMKKEPLARLIVELEMFIRNLAQMYFAQDDKSRKTTAFDSGRSIDDRVIDGNGAFEHWRATGGPEYFGKHFRNVRDVMRIFMRRNVGESPPPAD